VALKTTLSKRLFFGSIMLALLISCLIAEGWVSAKAVTGRYAVIQGLGFSLLLAFIFSLGALELIRLARNRGHEISPWVVIPAVVLLVTHPVWNPIVGQGSDIDVFLGFILILSLFTASWFQSRRLGVFNTLSNMGLVSFVLLYIGLGGWFVVQIRLIGLSGGTSWAQIGPVVMFLLCVKSADIGAYFTGRVCGKHLWVPSISPAKTWEGVIGGVVLAIIVTSLFSLLFDILPIASAVLFGLSVSLTGQMGDLLESMIKRDVGAKDSASLIPAFGGVLDLIDSIVVAAPFAYGLFRCLY
jgi:phosphatidate cytidylyltransferase